MTKEKSYYFDKIAITSAQEHSKLLGCLPLDALKGLCSDVKIRRLDLPNKSQYKSQLTVMAPSQEFLKMLSELELCFNPYKISYLEMARDTSFPTEFDAEVAAHNLYKTKRKKYSGSFEFDGRYLKKDFKKGLFSDNTYYFGNLKHKDDDNDGQRKIIPIDGRFQYLVYARESKITERPSLHEEWAITSAATIAKKTGISTMEDLQRANVREFFEGLEEKYLCDITINREKLGLWLIGRARYKKHSIKQLRKARLHGLFFCKLYHAQNASELVSFFMREKKRIAHKLGRRNSWENRILSIYNYNKFMNNPLLSSIDDV
jgi:hypothetical protein